MRNLISTQATWRSWRILVLPVLLVTGCAGMSNTDRGAVGGTAIGAGTGAVIGHALGNTGAGAVIGGGLGLITGAAIGNDIDRKEENRAVQHAAVQQAEAQRRWPSLIEIQRMSASGTNDTLIINEIRTTGAIYQLSPNDILWLQQNGVHDGVIAEMQATAARGPVVFQQGPPLQPGVVIVEERPPPPPVVGVRVGGGYYRRW